MQCKSQDRLINESVRSKGGDVSAIQQLAGNMINTEKAIFTVFGMAGWRITSVRDLEKSIKKITTSTGMQICPCGDI